MTETADSMVQEAMLLQRQNRVPESIDAYRRLLTRWPGLAQCWYNLGFLLRQAGQMKPALECYQRSLDTGIERPEEVHLNRSVIYTDYLGQHDSAERELQLALLRNAAYVPALLNYANLCDDLGRRPEALGLYVRILSIDSNCFEALARLANATPNDATGRTLIAPLQRALARPDASAADRASLGFALGRLLDATGEYPRAFAAYRTANADSLASAPQVAPYDRAWHEAFVDRLIASVDTHRPHPARETGVAAPRPIFICGMFRSGSTLTEALLSTLPGVAAGGELDFLPRLVGGELAPFPESLASMPAAKLDDMAARYRTELARICAAATYVIDKRPDNFFYIGLIKTLFPDARIVHTTRDPLDTCLSIYFLHLDQIMSYALNLADIGHYYRHYRRMMAFWKSVYPGDIFDFDYDELVREPQPSLTRLCEFLGLEWDGRLPQVAAAGRAIKTASAWQVREPLYRTSSGRARHYAAELEELRGHLTDLQ